ncbi:glycoside hydrolase family 35 protein [Moniliophthora roreri]|nr:glycoside hydrolase family 35 protein [Moniliophthora roreri]
MTTLDGTPQIQMLYTSKHRHIMSSAPQSRNLNMPNCPLKTFASEYGRASTHMDIVCIPLDDGLIN